MTKQKTPPPPPQESEEPVWTYRGYKLKTSEFVTAMVHLFRAEIQRANVWRQRLDTTTNWAVVSTGATLSIGFSQPNIHHSIIILNTLLVMWFLFIEARRYRYYELWSYRVRLMETDFFAAMLVPFILRQTGRKISQKIYSHQVFPSQCGKPLAAACAAIIFGYSLF